ncbi:MAG: RnfABCDGE type electron transport complex subunit G [Candidatus Omnitrophica bacterium]|nr:RnfABCDGE type electron transport complex subunit G [Candidatus Omnitrophota bacterium]
MNQMVKFGLILGVICLAATLVLAVTYEVTKPRIDAAMNAEEEAALKTVMPEADFFKKDTAGEIEYFEALKRTALIGYCVKVTGSGYGGYMRIIVGIDTLGTIKGVRILENQETPGLGSKINEVRPGEDEPYFLKQFKGKPAAAVAVNKDIDAIAGATISSKAVTDAIRKTVAEFMEKRPR